MIIPDKAVIRHQPAFPVCVCARACVRLRGGGGGGGQNTYTVCAAQWGGDFGTLDLEWGIHFRDVSQNAVINVSNAQNFQIIRSHFKSYQIKQLQISMVFSSVTSFYYINTNEIPGELSRETMIPSQVKITCYLYM